MAKCCALGDHADTSAERVSQYVFIAVMLLMFTASTTLTSIWCASMSRMGGMPMPGGWTMSMAWMAMPGQTWTVTAASFLCMWVVMMVAMMLPSLLPMLWRYRRFVRSTGVTRIDRLTTLVGLGYFCVWTLFGILVFVAGAALATLTMQLPTLARAAPLLMGGVLLIAGALQFTAWKAHYLGCCRAARVPNGKSANSYSAWRHGLRLGLDCNYCCANLMLILLVIGVMDLRAMFVVTAAISVERLLPGGVYIARASGVIAAGAGLFLMLLEFHTE